LAAGAQADVSADETLTIKFAAVTGSKGITFVRSLTPKTEVEMGSAPASGAVFRALTENNRRNTLSRSGWADAVGG